MQYSYFNMSEQSMNVTQLDLEGRKADWSLSPVVTLLSSGLNWEEVEAFNSQLLAMTEKCKHIYFKPILLVRKLRAESRFVVFWFVKTS